jgi:hypothetical protein
MKKTVLLFTAFLTALAAQAENVFGYEIPLLLKPIPKVSSFEWAETTGFTIDGETPTAEDYTATPETTFYKEDYENLENWVTFPMVISWVSTNINETTGEIFTQNEQKTIKTMRSLKNVLKDLGVTFAPTWNAPTFKKEVKTCKNGKAEHIYGVDCVCIVCETARREHAFEVIDLEMCARCVNYYDSYDTDKNGYLKLKETQGGDEVCNATVPKDDPQYAGEDYHTGWHDEDVADSLYNCSCECGYYAWNAEHFQHDFEAAKADPTGWSWLNENGAEDSQNHWKEVECARCEDATMWVSDPHTALEATGTGEDGSYKWVNWSYHSTSGQCARACGYTGTITEEHEPDENCYCAKCEGYAHAWEYVYCKSHDGDDAYDVETGYCRCIHCGKCTKQIGGGNAKRPPNTTAEINWVDEATIHRFGKYRDDETHNCYCGKYYQDHYFYDWRGDESDTCYYCEWTRTEASGNRKNKGEGSRCANGTKQGITLTAHGDKDCSTTYFNAQCPAEGCQAIFDDVPLSGGQSGKTVKKRLKELGISSVDDMPIRAYLKCVDDGYQEYYRINWVTKRNYDIMFMHDTFGWKTLNDILMLGNRGIEACYEGGAAEGKSKMDFCINLFGVPHSVTNDFTGKITTTYTYDNYILYQGTARQKKSGNIYVDWSATK